MQLLVVSTLVVFSSSKPHACLVLQLQSVEQWLLELLLEPLVELRVAICCIGCRDIVDTAIQVELVVELVAVLEVEVEEVSPV